MVIIIGSTHHNTLSMVRSFGIEGVNVNLILISHDISKDFVHKSKFVEKTFVVERVEEIDKILDKISKDFTEKHTIISCTDEVAEYLDKNFNRLKEHFHFFNTGSENTLVKYTDKANQCKIAKEVGFNVPKTLKANPLTVDKTLIKFPCIIKPEVSSKGGKHINICHNISDLNKALNEYSEKDEIIIQDFINKESEIVIVGLSLNSKVIIPGYIEKHREFKGATTFSTVKPIDNQINYLCDLSKEFISRIGYIGLFGIEFVKSKDKFFFIEINLRNDATTFSFIKSGINLPLIFHQSATSQDNEQNYKIDETNSMVEYMDFINVLKRKVGLINWIKQLSACKTKYYYNKEDLAPFWCEMKLFVNSILKKATTSII